MPRVKPLTRRDPREIAVLSEIASTLVTMQISRAELARKAGINASTMQKRMNDIGSMRLSELWAIQDARKKAGIELNGG